MVGQRAAFIILALTAWVDCTPASEAGRRTPAPHAARVSAADERDAGQAPSQPDTGQSHATGTERVIGLAGVPRIGCPPAPPDDPTLSRVELASFRVSRGHSAEVVRRILVRHTDQVSACAKQLRGSLDISLFVDATGAVTKAEAQTSEPALRPSARCLTQTMRDWRFAESKPPARASIRARFVLLAPRAPETNAPSCVPSLHEEGP